MALFMTCLLASPQIDTSSVADREGLWNVSTPSTLNLWKIDVKAGCGCSIHHHEQK
jgi:hypothetical protein